jgi:ADP-ribose pyrophosphatase YjhB (NUDIX family)
MISYSKDGRRFNYRVAGIVIYDNKILLHRVNDESHWSLPGGKVEFDKGCFMN